jgi:hypothetical protein
MSPTADARFDAIDRRGRAAARTLLDDLDAVAAREARTPAAEDLPITATGPSAPSEPTRVRVDRFSLRRTHRAEPTERDGRDDRPQPPRRRWQAAAAVAVVALAAGAVVVATRDDSSNVSSAGDLDYLLPVWLPSGFEPQHAIDIPDPASLGFTNDVAVYGDPGADDPWSATVAVTHLAADEELLGGLPSGGEAVTVDGHDARLREAESDGWLGGEGWEVEWQADDGRLLVSGSLSSDEVLAAAEGASADADAGPAIDESALPDGYELLARGPLGDTLLFSSLLEGIGAASGSGDSEGLAVAYADPALDAGVRPAIVVAQRRGPASAVDLLRLSFTDVDTATVRGHHAAIGRGDEPPGSAGENGVVAVQWAETEGQIVSVAGFGVDEEAVLRVADEMRSAAPSEVAELRTDHAVAAPRELGDLRAGEVVAASGTSDTGQWRIVANTRSGENVGALTLDRIWGAIGNTSSTTGDRPERPPLDLGADFSDGTAVVWGVLWVDAASVTVEAPDAEPVTLDIHEVEGWDRPVVAGSFPIDHFGPSAGTIVVARDAEGNEVGRDDEVLGP